MTVWAALLAACIVAQAAVPAAAVSPLRVWIDKYVFGGGETTLLEEAVGAGDGVAVLAGVTRAKVFDTKGHHIMDRHDLLWTGNDACHAALTSPALSRSNTVNCLPGARALTDKAGLVASLAAAYGPAAQAILPPSFVLPAQYFQLAAYVAKSGTAGAWVLKEGVHRGEGVVAVPGTAVLRRALERRFVLAQRFVADSYLLRRRPFTLRAWAVLAGGAAPTLRCYLSTHALLLFGDKDVAERPEARPLQDMIVNIFQQDRNQARDPWSIEQLRRHLQETLRDDGAAFAALWSDVERLTAAAAAAALPRVKAVLSSPRLARYQGGGVEILGLDFVVDSALRPWLIEVNSLPSMARKVVDCIPHAEASNASGKASGTAINDGSTSDKGSSVGSSVKEQVACKDNAMDAEKAAFVQSLLRLLSARRPGGAQGREEMHAVEQASSKCGAAAAAVLRDAFEVQREEAAAQQAGFAVLTQQVYRALACVTAGNASSCAALPPTQMPPAQACQADAGASSWAERAMRGVQALLKQLPLLDATAIVQQAPAPKPLVMSPSDALTAAWLNSRQPGAAAATPAELLATLCALQQQLAS